MDSRQKTVDKKSKDQKDQETSLSTAHCPLPTESGGPKGPEPTRYGDWEIGGKCVDF